MNDKTVSKVLNGVLPSIREDDQNEDRSRHKPVLGVTFVDAKGRPFGLQYAHLLTCEVAGENLVVTFTTHKVTLSGRGLFSPVKNCLMCLIQNHKREFVTCIPGGAARDFGQDEGWVVMGIMIEKIEEK